VFDGLKTRTRVAAARARRDEARFSAEDVRLRVEEDVRRAFDDLTTARRRVELLENASTLASELFDARVTLREAGQETAINVLDARSGTFDARISLADAEFELQLALLRLLLSTGELTPEALR